MFGHYFHSDSFRFRQRAAGPFLMAKRNATAADHKYGFLREARLRRSVKRVQRNVRSINQ